jgi:hypothetical protein
MRCERCDGLMVIDHYIDMESGGSWLQAWRCMCCGNVVDNQIKAHHSTAHPLVHRRRNFRQFQEEWRLNAAVWL